LPADTYCIPIFFPSEESYDVRTLNKWRGGIWRHLYF
jgi:hypothetical protein